MKPKAPHLRNHEVPTAMDHFEQREYETALLRAWRKGTHPQIPPSQQVRAHREYERAWFHARGFQPPASRMDYHLWSDAARVWRSAHQLLTNDDQRMSTGRTKKTIPRHALAALAYAVGYRYLRGLDAITGELANNRHLAKFKLERMEFLQEFNVSADAAHAINASGQNPGAALEVTLMFQCELMALCPWLELAGNAQGVDSLREAVKLR